MKKPILLLTLTLFMSIGYVTAQVDLTYNYFYELYITSIRDI